MSSLSIAEDFFGESHTEGPGRVCAVVNPAAGKGRAAARWRLVARRLKALGVETDMVETAGPGGGTHLARTAVEQGYRTIVAVGGDGTVHEVVNGIHQHDGVEPARLAVVAAGTGMDFMRNAALPRSIPAVAAAITDGHWRAIDLGISELPASRRFINFAETGLGAAVVAREAALTRSWPGRLSFLVAALGAAVGEENAQAAVMVDDIEVYRGPLVSAVVANGRYFGGGMKIAPGASMTDGQFDILILGDFSRAQLVAQIWKIYPGVHISHRKVLWVRGTRVRIEPSTPTKLDLDGELGGVGPYSFVVLPGALRVVVSAPQIFGKASIR